MQIETLSTVGDLPNNLPDQIRQPGSYIAAPYGAPPRFELAYGHMGHHTTPTGA